MDVPTEASQRIASNVIDPPHAGTETVSYGKSDIAHVLSSPNAWLVRRSFRPRTSSRSPCFKLRDLMGPPGAGPLPLARRSG